MAVLAPLPPAMPPTGARSVDLRPYDDPDDDPDAGPSLAPSAVSVSAPAARVPESRPAHDEEDAEDEGAEDDEDADETRGAEDVIRCVAQHSFLVRRDNVY